MNTLKNEIAGFVQIEQVTNKQMNIRMRTPLSEITSTGEIEQSFR